MPQEINDKSEEYSRIAERCIKQLLSEFREKPYNFFSESDVKCRLHQMLFQHKAINTFRQTLDRKLIWPLHTEVSYFDYEGKLAFQVDLSAVDPASTNVYSKPQPRKIKLAKGYAAGVCYFAIELKLNKLDSKRKMLAKWEKDMIKLTDIKTRNRFLACFSLLFDKKNNQVEEAEIESIRAKYPHVKMAYANIEGKEYLGNF